MIYSFYCVDIALSVFTLCNQFMDFSYTLCSLHATDSSPTVSSSKFPRMKLLKGCVGAGVGFGFVLDSRARVSAPTSTPSPKNLAKLSLRRGGGEYNCSQGLF